MSSKVTALLEYLDLNASNADLGFFFFFAFLYKVYLYWWSYKLC